MTVRRFGLLTVTAVAILVIASRSESPGPPWPGSAATALEPERVRIEHEFVRIPVTRTPAIYSLRAAADREPVRRSGRVARPGLSGKVPVRTAAPTREETKNAGLFSRAVQTIVGDGRYKPQPFPRPPG